MENTVIGEVQTILKEEHIEKRKFARPRQKHNYILYRRFVFGVYLVLLHGVLRRERLLPGLTAWGS